MKTFRLKVFPTEFSSYHFAYCLYMKSSSSLATCMWDLKLPNKYIHVNFQNTPMKLGAYKLSTIKRKPLRFFYHITLT